MSAIPVPTPDEATENATPSKRRKYKAPSEKLQTIDVTGPEQHVTASVSKSGGLNLKLSPEMAATFWRLVFRLAMVLGGALSLDLLHTTTTKADDLEDRVKAVESQGNRNEALLEKLLSAENSKGTRK